MPSPLVWSALIAAFLGFGVLMGKATEGTLAKRGPVMLVAASSPAQQAPSDGLTPPPAKAEETPETSSESTPSSKAESSSSESSSSTTTQPSSEQSSEQKEASSGSKTSAKLPAIKHVFVVMLSDQPYATAFGPASEAHYLTGTLEKQGTMLERYYGVAQAGLAGTIGLLSGQGPTEATAANCPTYANVLATGAGSDGQVLGQGCVYPSSTGTLPAQLAAKKLTWKAYVEGIDEGGSTQAACAHPAVGAGDPSAASASVGATGPQPLAQEQASSAGYQTWRNPFVYFQGITSSAACAANDVGLSALKGNLSSESKTASFSYVAPGPCVDGSPTACAPGKAAGMVAADGFLKTVIPEILASPAYKKNGLLAITVDAAPSSGEWADSSSCCAQPTFPNLPAPTGAAKLAPAGGGQVGMLLLSPFIKKGGSLVQGTYNHFSLLATVEQLFGLSKLGYAGLSEVKELSPSLFSGG
ncbi:MAG TPA: alkaline phosphatase family protein [Solirubrobacteraceae bacterium]|nr:alkaline phosphatase family protein [Solirubrobacteraceae bacterium]